MSKESTAKLQELVRRNLTESQREILTEMGVINDMGLLNVEVKNLQKADEVAPTDGQTTIRLKGKVVAHVGSYMAVDLNVFKNGAGQVYADSNLKGGKNPTTGKRWTTYIPQFFGAADEVRARTSAWTAFKNLVPAYLQARGEL